MDADALRCAETGEVLVGHTGAHEVWSLVCGVTVCGARLTCEVVFVSWIADAVELEGRLACPRRRQMRGLVIGSQVPGAPHTSHLDCMPMLEMEIAKARDEGGWRTPRGPSRGACPCPWAYRYSYVTRCMRIVYTEGLERLTLVAYVCGVPERACMPCTVCVQLQLFRLTSRRHARRLLHSECSRNS